MLNLESSLYCKGIAIGVLRLVEAQNPPLSSPQNIYLLKCAYHKALMQIGEDQESADYWVDYFMKEEV